MCFNSFCLLVDNPIKWVSNYCEVVYLVFYIFILVMVSLGLKGVHLVFFVLFSFTLRFCNVIMKLYTVLLFIKDVQVRQSTDIYWCNNIREYFLISIIWHRAAFDLFWKTLTMTWFTIITQCFYTMTLTITLYLW